MEKKMRCVWRKQSNDERKSSLFSISATTTSICLSFFFNLLISLDFLSIFFFSLIALLFLWLLMSLVVSALFVVSSVNLFCTIFSFQRSCRWYMTRVYQLRSFTSLVCSSQVYWNIITSPFAIA